jgi:hypothetical protein
MRATRANKPRSATKSHAGVGRRGRASRSGLPWLVAASLSGAALLGWIGLSNGMRAARR